MRSDRIKNPDPYGGSLELSLSQELPQNPEDKSPVESTSPSRGFRKLGYRSLCQRLAKARRELATARERILWLTTIQNELSSTIGQLTEMASTDVLTGLSNRRRFDEALEAAFSLSVLQGSALSVVMLDVDQFKSYNDSFGHMAGDLVLRVLAEQLLKSSRNYDVVARYGGEEFAILLPATDKEQAMECAERQRRALETFCWPLRRVTASFGVSTLNETTKNPFKLIEDADRALYRSKHQGRNRVTHYEITRTASAAIEEDERLRSIQTWSTVTDT